MVLRILMMSPSIPPPYELAAPKHYKATPSVETISSIIRIDDAQGGHCLVAWGKACRPVELGGLGIHNLQLLNHALRIRWLWLQKSDPNKPWALNDCCWTAARLQRRGLPHHSLCSVFARGRNYRPSASTMQFFKANMVRNFPLVENTKAYS